MKAIRELLENRGDNYILPFFWQHGEDEAVLREYVGAIAGCGIGAFCVEARPHPDFAGPGWWRDMDVILDEARRRGMKVWILDDAHFPTGFANGALTEADPSLCKQYLASSTQDLYGPVRQVTVRVGAMACHKPNPFAGQSPFLRGVKMRAFDDDRLFRVVAARIDEGSVLAGAVDLTDRVSEEGTLVWDVPAGTWRIHVLYLTRNGGGRTDYISVISGASCRVQIEAVYEPHWQHYKEDFGTTIAGFFSDEPLVGNTVGYGFDELIGRKKMPLPWSDELEAMLRKSVGEDWIADLPALWAELADAGRTARMRHAYMDAVTRLVRTHFSQQLGDWCRAHGVEYIGHLIEDNNQHQRLGCSLGHFFRGLDGQDMAGIDDIGDQVIPGGENHVRDGFAPHDGTFYHFALGKLGASHGHIDPKKKGRTMCEIFGAYGWSLSVPKMKWLADHFLVRGVNRFVPHAFSPKAFPDPDCPPHFYAHGRNPQYRHFGMLMRYMNRMCHLLDGGLHIAPAALLYTAESAWAGECMNLQHPARRLTEAQIDFDILPADVFLTPEDCGMSFETDDGALSGAGKEAGGYEREAGHTGGFALRVNGETFRTLIVPACDFIPAAVARFAARAEGCGFPVVFIDRRPSGLCEGAAEADAAALLAQLGACPVIPLAELAGWLTARGLADVRVSPAFSGLRIYRYRRTDGEVLMCFNENVGETFDGTVDVPAKAGCKAAAGTADVGTAPAGADGCTGTRVDDMSAFAYDAMENVLRPLTSEAVEGGVRLKLRLEPYESVAVVLGACVDAAFAELRSLNADTVQAPIHEGRIREIEGPWQFSAVASKAYPAFGETRMLTELRSPAEFLPDFSGFLRYETTFRIDAVPDAASLLVEESADPIEVWVNGEPAGMRIHPPYRLDVSDLLRAGENTLRIETATTLEREVNAMHLPSMFGGPSDAAVLQPTGLTGRVMLVVKE